MNAKMSISAIVLLAAVFGAAFAGTLTSCPGGVITTSGSTRYCVTTFNPTGTQLVYKYTNMADDTQVIYQVKQGTNADGTPKYVQCNQDGSTPYTTTAAPTTAAPTTAAPITEAPTTAAPITEAPTTVQGRK